MIRGKHRSCIWFSIIGKGVLNFVAFSPEMEGRRTCVQAVDHGQARMETHNTRSIPAIGVMCRGRKETAFNVNLQQKLMPRIFSQTLCFACEF
jgi:hypothetical protein